MPNPQETLLEQERFELEPQSGGGTLSYGAVAGFFERARDAACRVGGSVKLEETVTLSFEDPQRMFTVLSDARRRLMAEIMREPKTISELSSRLHRNRPAASKIEMVATPG